MVVLCPSGTFKAHTCNNGSNVPQGDGGGGIFASETIEAEV